MLGLDDGPNGIASRLKLERSRASPPPERLIQPLNWKFGTLKGLEPNPEGFKCRADRLGGRLRLANQASKKPTMRVRSPSGPNSAKSNPARSRDPSSPTTAQLNRATSW